MTENPKRKPWALWIAVVVFALLVAYPLSLGPARWLADHGWMPDALRGVLTVFYMPLTLLAYHGPRPISRLLVKYLEFWIE